MLFPVSLVMLFIPATTLQHIVHLSTVNYKFHRQSLFPNQWTAVYIANNASTKVRIKNIQKQAISLVNTRFKTQLFVNSIKQYKKTSLGDLKNTNEEIKTKRKKRTAKDEVNMITTTGREDSSNYMSISNKTIFATTEANSIPHDAHQSTQKLVLRDDQFSNDSMKTAILKDSAVMNFFLVLVFCLHGAMGIFIGLTIKFGYKN